MSAEPLSDGRQDFDFLLGRWNVRNRRLRRRLEHSADWAEFEAVANVRPILNGLGNVDTIAAKDAPDIGAFEGFTLRLFDPASRSWRIYWSSTMSPGVLDPPLEGSFGDGRGVFRGVDVHDATPVQVRFIWTTDSRSHASWEQAFSADEGQTWETNWTMAFTRIEEGPE